MKKTFISLVLFCVCTSILLNGCATVFSGSSDDITISSEPQGAKIIVNGATMGVTPSAIKFKKGKDYTIEIQKSGYEKYSLLLTSSLSAGWLILDIVFGLVPIIIDAVTGAWKSFDQKTLFANLTPRG